MKNLPTYREFLNEGNLPEDIEKILKTKYVRNNMVYGLCGAFAATMVDKFPELKVFGIVDYEYGKEEGTNNKKPTIQHYVLRSGQIYFDGHGIKSKEAFEKIFKGVMEPIDAETGLPKGKKETDFIDLPDYGIYPDMFRSIEYDKD